MMNQLKLRMGISDFVRLSSEVKTIGGKVLRLEVERNEVFDFYGDEAKRIPRD